MTANPPQRSSPPIPAVALDQEPPRSAPPATAINLGGIFQFFRSAITRRWKLLIALFSVGVVGSFAASGPLHKQTWEASGTMLHTPPPMGEAQRGLYAAPDLNTLNQLIKSPEVLGPLTEEFNLDVPPSLLEKLFKVTTPKSTQSIVVTLQWGDAEDAAKLTNRLMERFADLTREQRSRKMAGNLADAEARRVDNESRRTRTLETYEKTLRDQNVVNLAKDGESVASEIDQLRKDRVIAQREESGVIAQRERMAVEIASFHKKEQEDAEKEKQYAAEMESVTDARRRQDRIRELIEEDKMRQQWMAELTAKRGELDRLRALHQASAVSAQEVEAVVAQVNTLTAKLTDTQQVKKWKEELAKIDGAVVPTGNNRQAGSPIITQALFKRLEIDLQLVGWQKRLTDLEQGMTRCHGRQIAMQKLARETDGFRGELERLDQDRQRINDQSSFFSRMRDLHSPEVTIVTAARVAQFPVTSNRKLLVLAGVGGTFFFVMLLAALLEWRRTRHFGRTARRRAAVPLLGDLAENDIAGQRLAASQFRDWMPNYGAAAAFLGDGTACDPWPWALAIARRLAARDERVLLIDCRIGELALPDPRSPGLGDYLKFECPDWTSLIALDDSHGVELLYAGTADTMDLLATHRMRRLLDEARGDYSVTFLVGPSLLKADGQDLVARLSDGIVAVLSEHAPAGVAAALPKLAAMQSDFVRALTVGRDTIN